MFRHALCALLLLVTGVSARAHAAAEAAHCEASDGRGVLDEHYQQMLRVCGWRLLEPFAQSRSRFPDPAAWTRAEDLLPDSDAGARGSIRASEQLTALRVAGDTGAEPELYEMTYFNAVAKAFIEAGPDPLDRPGTTEALMAKNVREIHFPAGSAALKTFWYRIPKGGTVSVRVWDWAATRDALRLDVTRLPQRCVTDAAAGRDCLVAGKSFVTLRVQDEDVFRCAKAQCPSLGRGDLLILVGMHIASKQMPEWLWSTFWWQGPGVSEGTSWTCGAAQRPASLRNAGPWSNYAMNVTASFRKEKPLLAAGDPCGAPGAIAGGQELRATYNPFVEAREDNGLKSSCVDCHSRASTKSATDLVIPAVDDTGGPPVAAFEGHIRLDYLWSIRRSLNKTRGLPRDR